jgi:hypothetical protein
VIEAEFFLLAAARVFTDEVSLPSLVVREPRVAAEKAFELVFAWLADATGAPAASIAHAARARSRDFLRMGLSWGGGGTGNAGGGGTGNAAYTRRQHPTVWRFNQESKPGRGDLFSVRRGAD